MKNFRLMVLVATVALVMAPAASALAEGFYVTPKLGYSYFKVKAGGDSESKSIMPFGLAVGYDFKPTHDVPLRVEFEYAYRGKKEMFKFSENGYEPDPGLTADVFSRAEFGAQSFFINSYFDIHNSSPVTPYIGVGLGLARVSAEAHLHVRNVRGVDHEDFELNGSKTKTNFAWNIGAGAAWAINDFMSLDLGYRYADFGKVNPGLTYAGATQGIEAFIWSNDIKATAHEVMLGLRIGF